MKIDVYEIVAVCRAKKEMSKDPSLAVYMCRDLRITKAAGLDDLAWAIHRQGICSRGDAIGFFELLDMYIDGAMK